MQAVIKSEKELLEIFAAAKQRKEELEEELSKANAVYDRAKMELVEYLEDRDANRTARYEGIGYATLAKPRIYASCVEENKEKLFELVREKGREDLIKVQIHPSSLSSWIKELIEGNEAVPDFVSFHFEDQVRFYPNSK